MYVHLILRSSALICEIRCAPSLITAFGEAIICGKGFVGWLTFLHNLCLGRFIRVALFIAY